MTSLLEGRLSATSNTFMTAIYSQIVPQIPEEGAKTLSALALLAHSSYGLQIARAAGAATSPAAWLAGAACEQTTPVPMPPPPAARLLDDVKGWSEWFSMQSRTISSWLALLSSVLVCKHTYLSIFLYIIIMYTLLVESTQAHDVYSGRLRVKFMLHRCIYVLLGPLHPPPQWSWTPPSPCGVDGGKVMMALLNVILCFVSTGNGAVWICNGGVKHIIYIYIRIYQGQKLLTRHMCARYFLPGSNFFKSTILNHHKPWMPVQLAAALRLNQLASAESCQWTLWPQS